jgi:hypothetical protein
VVAQYRAMMCRYILFLQVAHGGLNGGDYE